MATKKEATGKMEPPKGQRPVKAQRTRIEDIQPGVIPVGEEEVRQVKGGVITCYVDENGKIECEGNTCHIDGGTD